MSCPALYCNLTTTPLSSSTQYCLQLRAAYFRNVRTRNAGWEHSHQNYRKGITTVYESYPLILVYAFLVLVLFT